MSAFKFFGVFTLAMVAVLAAGQGGQGGYQGPTAGADVSDRSLFLSPGDRTEWTFDAKENETILVRITSPVFDPAVAIQDESGTKLAENDDVEPGNQSSQLVYTVTKPGRYKVVVTNYKGTAGGSFDIHTERLFSVPLAIDEPKLSEVEGKLAWARFVVDKPGDFIVTESDASTQFQVVRSNGVEVPGRVVSQGEAYHRQRFSIGEPGMYYVRFFGGPRPRVRVAPVAVREIKIGGEIDATLTPDQVVDWQVHVLPNQVVEATVTDAQDNVYVTTITSPMLNDRDRLYATMEPQAAGFRLPLVTFHEGTITFTILSRRADDAAYRLQVKQVDRPWNGGDQLTDKLDWFGTNYWTFDAKPGDVVTLDAQSPVYEVNLQTMRPNGDVTQAAQGRRTPEVRDSFLVERAGRYFVKVSGGGVGPYQLVRKITEPKRLGPSEETGRTLTLAPEVWRFSAKKGQDFAFRLLTDLGGRFVIRNLNGAIIADSGRANFVRVVIPEDGEYNLSVTTMSPSTYRIKRVDLDQ
jgi:hypothetical protein